MEEKVEKILINNRIGKMTINFMGSFPNNKWVKNKGDKFYLNKREWEWVKSNIPDVLESGALIEEGKESELITDDDGEKKLKEFFAMHTNKAKAKIKKMDSIKEIDELIDYANDNELENKIVDALVERANELGE